MHEIDLEWNVRSFLPAGLQRDFEEVVSTFIDQLYRAKRQALVDGDREPIRIMQPSAMQSTGPLLDPTKEKESALAKKAVSKKLTRKMLALVQSILLSQKLAPTHPEIAEQLAFPQLPGAHFEGRTNAALEFVKTTCHVFSLARDLVVEVQILKRNLLDLCGTREFSDAAIFRNPCEVLKLPSTICHQCQSARDLDLCRDPDRLPQLVEVDEDGVMRWTLIAPRVQTWLCPQGHPLDKQAIEVRLVDLVQRLISQYVLQDVSALSVLVFL